MKYFLEPVKIYWNSNKNCFSVLHKGKVVLHVNSFELFEVEYKVSEAGRQRVLREKKKNVHAYICGRLVDYVLSEQAPDLETFLKNEGPLRIGYNPYANESFVAASLDRREAFAIKQSLTCQGIILKSGTCKIPLVRASNE